jgi:hypothetical protein
MGRVPVIRERCLTCRESAAYSRGCCPTCYQRHYREVRRGRTTWKKLERQGRAAAPRQRKRHDNPRKPRSRPRQGK